MVVGGCSIISNLVDTDNTYLHITNMVDCTRGVERLGQLAGNKTFILVLSWALDLKRENGMPLLTSLDLT